MSLWIFQSVVNLLLINTALFWILSRKRTKFLEAQVDRLEREVETLKSRWSSVKSSTTDEASKTQTVLNQLKATSSQSKTDSTQTNVVPTQTSAAPTQHLVTLKEPSVNAPKNQSSNVLSNEPSAKVATTASSLIEKQTATSTGKGASSEAFERASMMLSSGVNIKEISRLTGLSTAELQLMNKIAARTQ